MIDEHEQHRKHAREYLERKQARAQRLEKIESRIMDQIEEVLSRLPSVTADSRDFANSTKGLQSLMITLGIAIQRNMELHNDTPTSKTSASLLLQGPTGQRVVEIPQQGYGHEVFESMRVIEADVVATGPDSGEIEGNPRIQR